MTLDPALLAFTQAMKHRDSLLAYIAAEKIPISLCTYASFSPDHPVGINFQIGDDHWLAEFRSNGDFKQLSPG